MSVETKTGEGRIKKSLWRGVGNSKGGEVPHGHRSEPQSAYDIVDSAHYPDLGIVIDFSKPLNRMRSRMRTMLYEMRHGSYSVEDRRNNQVREVKSVVESGRRVWSRVRKKTVVVFNGHGPQTVT